MTVQYKRWEIACFDHSTGEYLYGSTFYDLESLKQCVDDVIFFEGDQWSEEERKKFATRAKPLSINRITPMATK